jgi:hypothetical protein
MLKYFNATSAIIIAICYTTLRFYLNIEYNGATWEQIYNLTAPIPFGYRILIPVISRPIVQFGFTIKEAYMFWEVIFTILLIYGLYNTFILHVSDRWSKTLTICFVYILPLLFLLKLQWPVYYPSDTPSMALVTWGIFLILKEQWVALAFILALATLNRESSILIPMIFVVIYIDKLPIRKIISIFLLMCSLYFLVRWGVVLLTRNNPAPYGGPMAFVIGNNWRVDNNISWLYKIQNVFILISTLGGIPIFYYMLRKYIPRHLRRTHVVVIVYFAMLLFIGNIYEPRIFGEISVILYISLALAIPAYLQNIAIEPPNDTLSSTTQGIASSLISFAEKYTFIIIGIIMIFAIAILNSFDAQYFHR